jgi:hypothetical protein
MSQQKKYDSTVARIAGNIFSGVALHLWNQDAEADVRASKWAVSVARMIVEETERTEPFVGETTTAVKK